MPDPFNPLNPSNPENQATDQIGKNVDNNFDSTEENENAVAIPLPSKGLFYYDKFQNREYINVRPLDWRDEDVLTTQQFFEDLEIFNKIVDRVILDKGIVSNSLLPVDRDTILLWLRSQAFGPEMEINYTCPSCNKSHPTAWDLASIEIPSYDENIYKEILENGEYKTTAPDSGIVVFLKAPTVGEGRYIEKRLKNEKNKNRDGSQKFGTETIKTIVSGVQDGTAIIRNKEEIEKYFDKNRLSLRDSRYIRRESKLLSLEYNSEKDIVCPHCNYIQEGVSLPIAHKNFFWPDI